VIEDGRLAIAWPRERRFDFVKDASGPRAHDHDAVSKHDRFIDVVSDKDKEQGMEPI